MQDGTQGSGVVALLGSRRFAPLFVTQFLGGLNDNLYKQTVMMMVAYGLAGATGMDAASLTAIGGATFVLPFVLFSAFAGRLADASDKGRLAARLKALELGVMALAAGALLSGSVTALFGVLFLLGVQATLFGPVKYSLLPTHLRRDELVLGNALVEGATFISILLGSIVGGLLAGHPDGTWWACGLVLAIAAGGLASSRAIPSAPPAPDAPSVGRNPLAGTMGIIREARSVRPVWLSILGISWFWTFGGTLLSIVPTLSHDLLNADQSVASLLLGVFSVGIAAGSFGCARLLRGEISPRHVPFAGLAMSGLLVAFAAACAAVPAHVGPALGISGALATPGFVLVAATMLLLASASGFFAVPLYAILQHESPESSRARMIGANNVVNSLMMVVGALAVAALSGAMGLSVPGIALVLAAANLIAAIVTVRLLSRVVLKSVARALLGTLYRVEVRGAENLSRIDGRTVVVSNHQSFLDAAVIAAFMPGDPVFAVNTEIARRWWARPILAMVDSASVDPTNPMALKGLVREVEKGRPLVIFPEGRLTVTGSLMKVYDGPGLVADRAKAEIVPVRLDGLQHTFFTRLGGIVARRLLPKVTVTVLPPRRLEVDGAVKGRQRRKDVGRQLYDLMSDTIFATTDTGKTLFRSLVEASSLNGRSRAIAEDVDFTPMTYGRLVTASLALGGKLAAFTADGERVGLLLPNSVGALVTFFALQAKGRVPAMLNFSVGAAGMLSACGTAQVRTVLCSRRFVEKAKLGPIVAEMERHVRFVYLEDVRASIGPLDRARALMASFLTRGGEGDPDAAAVVLFTSGSEGAPKGVVLSHRNLQANRHQVGARIDFSGRDKVFNSLPMFHSFGLTVGTLLPVLSGIPVFLYPSPLHYRIVPELVYGTNSTVLFGTDTFLRGYARMANPYDFRSVRLVGAGAERVADETRRLWGDRFGLRILEGYGATETAPVIAFNTPMHFRAGTVGRLMPGIDHRIEPVPGIEGGGRLSVRGPNVMLGYMLPSAPGQLQPPAGGWYDTGDIVEVDGEGFVSIKGRAKRFAKVAGEMVSLVAVEGLASESSPGHRHAAVTRPDPRKGEQVVLFTEDPSLTRQGLSRLAQERGVPALMLPAEIAHVSSLPVLGTGKTDYPAIEALARTASAAAA